MQTPLVDGSLLPDTIASSSASDAPSRAAGATPAAPTARDAAPFHRPFCSEELSGSKKGRASVSIAALERRIADASADIEAAEIGQATRTVVKRLTQARQRLEGELADETASSTTSTRGASATPQSTAKTQLRTRQLVDGPLLPDAVASSSASDVPFSAVGSMLKQFRSPDKLAQHERVHTIGGAVFGCLFCPKQFRHKSTATQHGRVHTNRDVFCCSFCPKQFGCRSKVTRHERIHTGKKPYACSMCPRRFAQKTKPGRLPAFQTTVRWPKATVLPPATMVGGPRRRRFFWGEALSNHRHFAQMASKPGPWTG